MNNMKTPVILLALSLMVGCKTTKPVTTAKQPPIPKSAKPKNPLPPSIIQRKSLATSSSVTLTVAQPQVPLVFAAYWTPPVEPGWIPQWSTNLADWNDAVITTVYTTGPGVPWTGNFFVRLIKRP